MEPVRKGEFIMDTSPQIDEYYRAHPNTHARPLPARAHTPPPPHMYACMHVCMHKAYNTSCMILAANLDGLSYASHVAIDDFSTKSMIVTNANANDVVHKHALYSCVSHLTKCGCEPYR